MSRAFGSVGGRRSAAPGAAERRRRLALVLGLALAIGLGGRPAAAQTPEAAPAAQEPAAAPAGASALEAARGLSAEEIARRVNARDTGRFVSRLVTMELVDKGGSVRVREARFFRRQDGEDRKLAVFYESPASIRDTAFLAFDYADPEKSDDHWLYLPAMRRTRRIASSDRGNSFLGTDLTYEEVKKEMRFAVEDYVWERLDDAEADGHPCAVLRATPRNADIARDLGYGRIEYCVDPEIWMVRRAEFWDRADRPLKTVSILDIRMVDGIATAHRIEAHNHRTEHSTVFRFGEADYTTELPEDLFTELRLRHGWR